MSKKSIIQLIDSLNVGGAEMMSINIANLLNEEGFDSHICATRQEGGLKDRIDDQVKYLFLKRTKTVDLKAVLTLKRYIRSNSIGIIHAHSSSIFLAVLVKLMYWNLKIIWHDHYGVSLYIKRPIIPLKVFSLFMNTILSVSKNLQNWSLKNLYCKKTLYLPNFAVLKEKTLNYTNLKGTKGKRIVIIAGLRPQKDHFTLIKAFKMIFEFIEDWSLHIVGSDYNDVYSSEVKEMIDKFQLNNSIYFYGARHDIKNILDQSDIAVLSSKSEGLPVSLLEYGLGKVAAICTNVGQCSEVLTDKKLLISKENSILLAESIKLLIRNPKYRETSAKELYKNVFTNFGRSTYKKKLIEIYKNV